MFDPAHLWYHYALLVSEYVSIIRRTHKSKCHSEDKMVNLDSNHEYASGIHNRKRILQV